MKKAIKLLLVSLAVMTLLTACKSEPPTAQMSEARQLIDAVIAAGGQEFSPDKIVSLNKRYEEALADIKAQEDYFFKNYSVAQFTLNRVMDDCDALKVSLAASKGIVVAAAPKRVKYAE